MATVVLTGFMGTGKTRVGQELARRFGRPFIDTDELIERTEGRPISEIFARQGEPYFRTVERRAVAQAVAAGDAVIATGGGAISDPENLARLKAAGPIVCLVASPEVILARTEAEGDIRPLLKAGSPRQRIRELLAERAPAYASADLTVDTSSRSVEEVVTEIGEFLRRQAPAAAASPAQAIETVTVDLRERSYPICIGAGTLDGLGTRLCDLHCAARVAVVTNPIVAEQYEARVIGSLRGAGFDPVIIQIPAGEEHKNLAWLTLLYDRFIDARLERRSAVIALGGGVIGDLAGFAAATFLRGLTFVQVPTTLVAQVDSSVGGKTGVNHAAGKNLIGAFYQPRLVWIDVQTLRTLPRRELLAGLAEVIKYGAILSPELFGLLEKNLDQVLALEDEIVVEIVRVCCALKAMVVGEDERETSGYREILNFGHTFGHAVEMLTEYRQFLHGEAVAIGMVCAARLSHERGHCSPAVADRLTRFIRHAGLPVAVPREITARQLALAIETDKKASGGTIKFVCLEDIGRTRFESLTAEEISHYAVH